MRRLFVDHLSTAHMVQIIVTSAAHDNIFVYTVGAVLQLGNGRPLAILRSYDLSTTCGQVITPQYSLSRSALNTCGPQVFRADRESNYFISY